MALSKDSCTLAIRNVAHWGDTDVLPFPIENHWLFDDEETDVDLLQRLHLDFDKWIVNYPLEFERTLSAVGYVGFRATTQIDAIWNAYLMALVIEVGPDIESARIRIEDESVFSYRFSPDTTNYSLFNRSIGWRRFQERALELARSGGFVVSMDTFRLLRSHLPPSP